MIVTLQAGDGSGRTAVVTAGGSVSTEVTGTVTTRGLTTTVQRTLATVGTTSGEVLDDRASRRSLWIQNKDATKSVHVRFGDTAATTDDWKIAPGGELRAEGVFCESAVQAIASGADTSVLFLEFVEAA